MIYASMFHKHHRSPLSKLRQQHLPVHVPPAAPEWSGDGYADLVSRDKTKVKEAIRHYLAVKVRGDWSFAWPPAAADDQQPHPAAADEDGAPEPPPSDEPQPVQDEARDDDGYRVDSDSDVDEEGILEEVEDDDSQSIYSVVSEDPVHYRPRQEWDSDVPLEELLQSQPIDPNDTDLVDVQGAKLLWRAQKRRELRRDLKWNEGLACFEARRNAWTQARTVRLRAKPECPQANTSQRSSRRFFFRRSTSSTSSSQDTATRSTASESPPPREPPKSPGRQNDKASSSSSSARLPAGSYPVETIIPVAPPILPPNNPLRAAITPGNYLQLYDKIIVNNMQPSCPINLSDMISACVVGWKRDGEWPPRPTLPVDPTFSAIQAARRSRKAAAAAAAAGAGGANHGRDAQPHGRRLSLTGLLSRDKEADGRAGKSVRQSISKVFGLGSPLSPPPTDAAVEHDKTPARC